jgi:hypothetical protein
MNATAYQIGPIEAKFRAEAAERRRRFMEAKPPAPKLKIVARCSDIVLPPKPLWKQKPIAFNDHLIAWQLHRAAKVLSPIPAFISEWCASHGTAPEEMTGHSRKATICALRHELIYEIYHRFKVSLPQLGRILGGRDHTTMLNSLRKVEEQRETLQK